MSNTMHALTSDSPDIDANDLVMSKEMADSLHTAYPGHLWAVQVEGKKGVCYIRNLALVGNWGFVIKLPAIYSASEFKKRVLRGGGEILERYRLRRGAVDHDAIEALPMDRLGNTIGDRAR